MERIFHGRRIDLYTTDSRELVVHPGAVVILPFLDPETVILIRNERFAVEQTLWELPAGTLEKDEKPKSCALRELEEETGYRAASLSSLLSFYTSPGFCNEILHAFVAQELIQGPQNLDPSEKIEVVPTPLSQALSMVQSGEICDAKTICALLYYATFSVTK